MKKLTPRYQAWQFRRQRNEERRRKRRRSEHLVRVYGIGGVVQCTAPEKIVPLPSNFCLEQNRDEVVEFLESLRSRFARRVKHRILPRRGGRMRTIGSYFDFTVIRRITPAAALVLAAEYDRARLRSLAYAMMRASRLGRDLDVSALRLPLIDIDRWEPQVVSSLLELGFFRLLDIEDFVPKMPERDKRILPFVSGSKVDSELTGELTDKLRTLLETMQVPNQNATVHLHGRIIEAVQNVRDHAYPPSVVFRYPSVGRWWATASVDASENRLDMIVYDQGVTIPGSIPVSPRRSVIAAAFRRLFGHDEDFTNATYDGDSIKAAIEAGETQTDEPHRGKGLMFMRELVTCCRSGELRIHSRNGAYLYRSDGHEEISAYEGSIGGTLIEWHLYL